MTLQSISGGLMIPPILSTTSSSVSFASLLIDAANEKAAFIFQVPKAGGIRKLCFRTRTVTTGATVDVRLETVDGATGNPSGTLWGTNTNASQVIQDTDDNCWFATQLTADATVAQGDIVAIVVSNPSSSFGNLSLASFQDSNFNNIYSLLYTGTWAKNAEAPVAAIEYSDGTYGEVGGLFPFSSDTGVTSAFSVDSAGFDEIALKFQVPFPCRVVGAWMWSDIDGTAELILYNASGTALLTKSYDPDIRRTTSPAQYLARFSASQVLSKDTTYYLALKPTTTTGIAVNYIDVASSAVMDSLPGGTNFIWSQRIDAGAWSDTATRRPFMGLMIDALDDGVGGAGGGLLIHQGMNGGISG